MLKIAIDGGHGPDTPGKRCPDDSMREFHFNSVVARYVRDELMQYNGVQTIFTHADDGSRDVPLKERTDKANAWGADLLVSIHANAAGDDWSDAQGIETFVYKTRPADAVKLAEAVQKHLIAATGLKNRGVKADDLHMLRETKMTAILVECGFMTNRTEAELLKSDQYRRKCAKAIVAGIAEVYGLQKKQTTSTSKPSFGGKFKDVPDGHYAKGATERLAAKGIMNGVGDDLFGFGRPITREDVAVVVDRAISYLEQKISQK
ncbi:N-acetylmuramoyl-L-alanine amidase [Brevibacillus composti]|uniref:N-acetylmuramoyl-L-alanine amidase n=1 Tax=Brevibacillus composti TaxID=2796470 RepID=A0ABX7Z8N3_9BACL|nr:N-acetylmuramoyl-L-alanine amidase [Brevibacillus composti]QUO43472.1 N-acetylmuramoyl-L-alanine amidase [Brevibacillus composti]